MLSPPSYPPRVTKRSWDGERSGRLLPGDAQRVQPGNTNLPLSTLKRIT